MLEADVAAKMRLSGPRLHARMVKVRGVEWAWDLACNAQGEFKWSKKKVYFATKNPAARTRVRPAAPGAQGAGASGKSPVSSVPEADQTTG